MTSKANKTCKYPELKAITEKERTSTWSEQKYTVESITEKLNQEYYKTSKGSRLYLRFEC